MKILQVSPRYYPNVGGVETHVQQISERLAERGHQVEVACTDRSGTLPGEEKINGVCIRRFKSWAPNEAYYFSDKLKRYLAKKSQNFEIVHAHNYHAFPALYAARAKNDHSFIFTPHFLGSGQTEFRKFLHHIYKFAGKEIFENSQQVICVSEFERDEIKRNFELGEEKIKIIPNGVNIYELKRYPWKPGSILHPRICYAGRFEKRQKNIDKLVESIRILVKDKNIDTELFLIGSGPFEKGVQELIKSLDIGKNVFIKKFLPRNDFLGEVSSCNVFVMPSEYECYGITAAEAIVMGVPTLVTDSSALHEFVKKGLATGIPTPVTPHRIAESINMALQESNDYRTPDWSCKIISWDQVVDDLERVYFKR
jgi:glycosyltransferase involved in cell wall biosynthesis